MALLTLADMRTEVYDTILDTDSANRSVDTTTLNRLLNRCYGIVRGVQDDRPYFVAAATSGATFAPQVGSGYMVLMETTYRRIIEIYPAVSAASSLPYGPALSRWEPWEIFAMQREDPTNREIYASAYAVWRAGTATAANVGKWNLSMWPCSTISYSYLLQVLKEVTALAVDGDKADASEQEQHWMTDMASGIASRWLGRPEEFIAQILGRLPEQMRGSALSLARELGMDRERPAEEVA